MGIQIFLYLSHPFIDSAPLFFCFLYAGVKHAFEVFMNIILGVRFGVVDCWMVGDFAVAVLFSLVRLGPIVVFGFFGVCGFV